MAKQSRKRRERIVSESQKLSVDLLAGALVKSYHEKRLGQRGETLPVVSLSEIREALGRDTKRLPKEKLREEVQSFLRDYKWLGLAWIESSNGVGAVRGIHWFADSSMYDRLIASGHERLAELFAQVSKGVKLPADLRLLVDAGSTTFHCLSHPKCILADRALEKKGIMTNNLFVAQWLRGKKEVTLIEGSWDAKTGATVNVRFAAKHLGGRTIGPNVAILSWHYVRARDDDIIFYTEDMNEVPMKKAAVKKTRDYVFMVVSKEKFKADPPLPEEKGKPDPPPGAPEYSFLNEMLKTQDPKGRREIFLVTDFEKMEPVLEKTLKVFQRSEVMENRIWLVSRCEKADTRPADLR